MIWEDKNNNGIQDVGEIGIPGAVVTLLDANGTQVVDANGTAIPSKTTDSTGKYCFCGLPEGD